MKFAPALTAVIVLVVVGVLAAADRKEPTPAEIQKMRDAAPKEPRVKPQKPRRLLVYSVSWGYWHDSIPYGAKVAQILGEKTGAFETIFSDDPRIFEADSLRQFDAILFNNTNNEIFLPEDMAKLSPEQRAEAQHRDALYKKNLVVFLQQGGGLAVIHAGVASFREWPEYGNIIGARFTNHPWNSGSTVALKVDEPDHPLAAAFKDPRFTFSVRDEIYQVGDPYSREKLRVLLSIDTAKTNMRVQGIERKDGDFAMSWIKTYGTGRVFYNAFGHDHDIFWNPVILQHWLDGIQYVLGDLPADAKPSR